MSLWYIYWWPQKPTDSIGMPFIGWLLLQSLGLIPFWSLATPRSHCIMQSENNLRRCFWMGVSSIGNRQFGGKWKRRTSALGMSKFMAMTKNVMEIVTIIPPGKISTKGILFVRYILKPNLWEEVLEKWGKLWTYFNSYLMSSMAFVATWNILDEDEKYFDLENRNNNALENYNHMMNNKFPTPHPSLLVFVQTIKQESQKQVERCARIFTDE